ncbi:hypothetical protein M0R36_04250 [bacterium]|jgi:hypothetical protein|nr:hypothetical protein [bacterium]
MNETVREKILQNLKTTLESITTDNGYNFDFNADTVQRWSMHGNSLVDVPTVILSPGDEEEKGGTLPYIQCELTVYLDVFFINNESDSIVTDTYLNRLQGDIKKAVLSDYSRGGYAIDTNVRGTTPFETTEGQQYAGIIIEIGITYQHKRNDPTLVN